MAKLFGDNNANLDSLAVYHTKDRGAEIVVKASGAIPVEEMAQILVDAGFDLKGIVQTTKFGTTKVFEVPEKSK
jgi:deoxyribose-phosphate aldolase